MWKDFRSLKQFFIFSLDQTAYWQSVQFTKGKTFCSLFIISLCIVQFEKKMFVDYFGIGFSFALSLDFFILKIKHCFLILWLEIYQLLTCTMIEEKFSKAYRVIIYKKLNSNTVSSLNTFQQFYIKLSFKNAHKLKRC